MKRKMVLCALCAIVASAGLLVACSDDSSAEDSLMNVPANTSHLRAESFDFKKSSCKEQASQNSLAKSADASDDESIEFYINEDGSATVNLEMGILCSGLVSLIYETKNDTLFVTENYFQIYKELDTLSGDSVIVGFGEKRSHCSCRVDLELKISAPFVGTKYAYIDGACRTIVYKKRS